MKKILSYMLFALVIPALLLSGCKKDKDENKYEILVDYLKSQSLDIPTMHGQVESQGWAVSATALNTNISDYHIIDIRAAADFAGGHIPGAVNTTLANVLNEAAKAGSKKIIIVCYSGQVAAYALAACRLSGYPKTFFLKWGMSAWNSERDVWTGKIGDIAIGNTNWTTPPAFKANQDFGKTPQIDNPSDDGATILKERIAKVLADGPKFVQPADLLGNPSGYFINNYWTEENVTTNGNGHIKDAHRILPITIANNEVKFLNPSDKIVTYCWTGQTSAAVTFYLNVIGYEAYGLQWGCNALNNSQLSSNKWPEGQQNFPMNP
jgi:rhodanese-related sulfurtransferase